MNFIDMIFLISVILLFVTGFYSLILTRNLIRILISLEILTKGVTLLLIIVGHLSGQIAKAQAFVITLIIIEVIIIAIAAGIILGLFNKNNSLDTKHLKNLKE